MRITPILATAVLAAAPVAGLATPAGAAAPATTYHGTFSQVSYDCGGSQWQTPAGGTWNVTLRSGSATGTFNIFVDGVHHVAYGVPQLPATVNDGSWSFSFETQAGMLVVSYDGSTFSYGFPDGYDYGGLSCDTVVYSGS